MDKVAKWMSGEGLTAGVEQVRAWVVANVLTVATLGQIVALVAAFALARMLAPAIRAWLDAKLIARVSEPRLKRIAYALLGLTLPMIWLVLQWLAIQVEAYAGWPYPLLKVAVSLVAAWIVIHLTANLVRDPVWSKIVAFAVWTVAALNILGILDDAIAFLDGLAFSLGKIRVSALAAIKAALLMAILLWAASWFSAFVERRLQGLPRLAPSVQLLFGKLFKISLFVVAVLIALGSIGIDITALAVFTGAVGVGIGFGLQSMVSNFVAGVILLVERSLKIGDFIELPSGVRGEVREINIRNTVVTTNDSIDIIVPNSEFVNGTVTNWTFHEVYRRIRVPFGVAYGTDKQLVRKAGLEAAAAVEHTLRGHPKREAQVWLVGFGDNCLNFELVVWLAPEAVKRPAAVNAAYCWELESALSRYGIEIPFPQRDLHIRSSTPLRIDGGEEPAERAHEPMGSDGDVRQLLP
jgi:potassium-dependent mechanosensitive channel